MTMPGPTPPNTEQGQYRALTEVADYDEAQRLVDYLSDNEFPVEHTRIIGTGIRSVEQVTGRQTNARAAGRGAGAGDRKSTRLNSSHVAISYAVFCLKKKIILIYYFKQKMQT